MSKQIRTVYVAGPYSSGAVETNVYNAIRAGHRLMDLKLSPFIPHLFFFMNKFRSRPYENWLQVDLEWVTRADALLRLPGVSPGADREVERARQCGLPVLLSMEELEAHIKQEA